MLLRLIYIFIFLLLSSFCYSDDMDVLRQITMYEKVLLGADRLTFAEYGEHATIETNPNRYDEKVIEYNANGGIKRFQRRGLKDDNVYGKIDNLHIQLDGNRLQKVTDDALPLYRSGASDFVDGADNDVEYTYNGAGAMTSDANRGIANIEYDNQNHPQRVTFTNGNTIKYVYAPDGTKLRTIWLTAVDNIIVPVGSDYELSRNQILYADSTDYVGNAVYHNGNADKYLFDGGYCSFENSTPVFHYYTKDHLGNNRVVTNDNGTTEQTTHYYPFGGIITDISTNPSLQPYKYNGKELDRMHGWDKYDYGARMYDPILTVWTSVDPLAEKYYDVSPYAYCGNNPVNAVDPDGKKVWVFATRLPGSKSWLDFLDATHTFVVVRTSDGRLKIFEYGPQGDALIDNISGMSLLKRNNYIDSSKAVDTYMRTGQMDENTKNVIPVSVPDNMASDEFDKAVIKSASDFDGNKEMYYRVIPSRYTEGNCNTSTTSLLKNAGVPQKEINRIGENLKGIITGFGTQKAWTKEERQKAAEKEIEFTNSLTKQIGF